MGTRADFYVGTTAEAEWLGSIGFDGYPDGIDPSVLDARDVDGFRRAVGAFLEGESSATLPERGWPWPWNDSGTTDYAYMLDAERAEVLVINFGTPLLIDRATWDASERDDVTFAFPDMSERKAVAYDHRSGAMFISVGAPADPEPSAKVTALRKVVVDAVAEARASTDDCTAEVDDPAAEIVARRVLLALGIPT